MPSDCPGEHDLGIGPGLSTSCCFQRAHGGPLPLVSPWGWSVACCFPSPPTCSSVTCFLCRGPPCVPSAASAEPPTELPPDYLAAGSDLSLLLGNLLVLVCKDDACRPIWLLGEVCRAARCNVEGCCFLWDAPVAGHSSALSVGHCSCRLPAVCVSWGSAATGPLHFRCSSLFMVWEDSGGQPESLGSCTQVTQVKLRPLAPDSSAMWGWKTFLCLCH